MALTIPDRGEGLHDLQSIVFQEYIDILVAGIGGSGPTSACAVTPSAGMVVAVSAGQVVRAGVIAAVGAATPTVTAAHATNPRLDIVVVTAANSVDIRAGTAALAPKPPALTAGDIALAVIYVPALLATVTASHIVDLRVLVNATQALDSLKVANNSASPAVTITQTGAGHALLVEDSASTDSSPLIVDYNGRLVVGNTAAVTTGIGTPSHQVVGASASAAMSGLMQFTNDSGAANLVFAKSRGALGTVGTSVLSGDGLGLIQFLGDDSTSLIRAATIQGQVDTTPGVGSMPGRFVFSTTPTGSTAPVERMRIDSKGRIGIGIVASIANKLQYSDTITDTTVYSSYMQANVSDPSGTTGHTLFNYLGVPTASYGSTGAVVNAGYNVTNQCPGTISQIRNLSSQCNLTGGGTVTSRYGYMDSGLVLTSGSVISNFAFTASAGNIGATNNYGFYGDITSGTGRWNFYAAGTANNAFAGNTRLGGVTAPTVACDVTGAIQATETIKSGSYTVATLPAGASGQRAFVTDALTPTFLGALTGGGDVVCPAFHSGTAWVAG